MMVKQKSKKLYSRSSPWHGIPGAGGTLGKTATEKKGGHQVAAKVSGGRLQPPLTLFFLTHTRTVR